jgi:protein-tyrosine phosphatase
VHLLTQRGLDVSTHYAQAFTEAHGRSANLILTATQAHKAEIQNRYPNLAGKTFTISEYAIGRPADIADAFGQNAAFYQRTIEQIDAFIAPALRRAMGKEPR